MKVEREGGCSCGSVRFRLRDKPDRFGVCHCMTFRKATGSVMIGFAVWPRENFTVRGERDPALAKPALLPDLRLALFRDCGSLRRSSWGFTRSRPSHRATTPRAPLDAFTVIESGVLAVTGRAHTKNLALSDSKTALLSDER
jgi:hypothetical protein